MTVQTGMTGPRMANAFLPEQTTPSLTILTGPRGSGKTTLCQRLIMLADERKIALGGVCAPAVMQRGVKTGIDLIILPERERRKMAVLRKTSDADALLKHWALDEAVLAWGNAHLARLAPPELLIIDELGPLELAAGRGLQAALPLLDGRGYRWGVVVIRPELLAQAQKRWPWAQIVALSAESGMGAAR